jgi:hypothetical protein
VSVSLSTVGRTKRRFVEGNLERALSEEPRPGAERKLTGKEEALLVATACAKPPAGRKRWTLTLLADTMVKLTDHDSLSGETVRRPNACRSSNGSVSNRQNHCDEPLEMMRSERTREKSRSCVARAAALIASALAA